MIVVALRKIILGILGISFWAGVCNALITENYTLIEFFETPLSDYNTHETDIITDGFFFSNNSITVYDVIYTFTHDTPYLTDTGLYFIDGNGAIIASLIGNITTEIEQDRMTLDNAIASAITNTTAIDDPDAANDMIDYANDCLTQINQLRPLIKRANPANYICGYSYGNCRSYVTCNREYSPNSGKKCGCLLNYGAKICLTYQAVFQNK